MSGSAWSFLKDLGAMNLRKERLFRVIFMVTRRCPLRCMTCGIWKEAGTASDPSLEEIKTFFSKNSFSWINLTGGEVFLRNDIPEIFQLLAKTQDRLCYVSFPTSGFLVEKTVLGVQAALQAGLSRIHVTVSFDGGRSSHDILRGSEEAFDRAAETYTKLKEMATATKQRVAVHPGMTLSADLLELTEDPAGDLVRDLGLSGIHEIHLNLAHASSHYYDTTGLRSLPAPQAVDQLQRILEARRGRITAMDIVESLYLKGARNYLDSGKSPLPCKACSASVFIDPQWRVYPCTIYDRVLGNLAESDFDLSRVARGEPFQKARAAAVSGLCPGCWTPCEAFTALAGNLLKPAFYRLLIS